MSVYLISYDLVDEKKNPQHDYQVLWDELKRLKAFRTNLSVWLISVDNTPNEILEHFKNFVDANDRIWITKLRKGQFTYTNAIAGTKKWLEGNPPEA